MSTTEAPRSGAEPEPVDERERGALLAAAAFLVAKSGFAAATTEAICTRAKVPIERFGVHFEGRGGLLRALNENFVAQMLNVTDQVSGSGTWKGAPARDVIEVAVKSIIDIVIDHQALVRAFIAYGATDPTLTDGLRQVGVHLSERLIEILRECDQAPARPEQSVPFAMLIAVSLAHHHILVGDAWAGQSFTKAELAEQASRAICAYLGLGPTISLKARGPDVARTISATAPRRKQT